MKKYSFCSDWTCKHLDAPEAGASVQIPHDAMLAEKRSALAASGINGAWFEGHDYLYEKLHDCGINGNCSNSNTVQQDMFLICDPQIDRTVNAGTGIPTGIGLVRCP